MPNLEENRNRVYSGTFVIERHEGGVFFGRICRRRITESFFAASRAFVGQSNERVVPGIYLEVCGRPLFCQLVFASCIADTNT